MASSIRRNALMELVRVLRDDLNIAIDEFGSDRQSQMRRRALVRALFALIEGTLNVFKRNLTFLHSTDKIVLDPARYSLLAEEAYDLQEDGSVRKSPKYTKLTSTVRFVLPLYAEKTRGEAIALDVKGKGWKDFKTAVGIRNRITHPRVVGELDVSDDEMKCVLGASKWFSNAAVRALRKTEAQSKGKI